MVSEFEVLELAIRKNFTSILLTRLPFKYSIYERILNAAQPIFIQRTVASFKLFSIELPNNIPLHSLNLIFFF